MDNIVVITQNLKLDSITKIRSELKPGSILIVSTQFIFENEVTKINALLGTNCKYLNFSALLTDEECEQCDKDAFNSIPKNLCLYYSTIKAIKNKRIVKKILRDYPCNNLLLLCNDLGIDEESWIKVGFRKIKCDYYHNDEEQIVKSDLIFQFFSKIKEQLIYIKEKLSGQLYISHKDRQKYLFFGSTNRVGYRIALKWERASRWENLKFILQHYSIKLWNFMPKNSTIRLSSFHEDMHWNLPDHPNFNVRKVQDGYLPPNYSSCYLYYYGTRTEFWTWDIIGRNTFNYHNLNSRVMPVRNKLYLPTPNYSKKVRKVLCVASGAGDWTAIKNRSDEDMMLWAFGEIAAMFPNIEFVYRCHPVWVHPQHQGVNSVNRAGEYYAWLNLPNLKLSCNLPNAVENDQFVLSYKRSSFEEDLKDVDIVFGEHSVSMIDAGFKNIIFSSCNMTGHRNYFEDITKLGFPHCESLEEIADLLRRLPTPEFKQSYDKAIKNYNEMTDKEE